MQQEMLDDATRQEILYANIWAADSDYGTRPGDVYDTVFHRIVPHMRRVLAGPPSLVVDFGAGDGRFLRELRHHGIRHGVGIDLYEPTNKPEWMDWQRVPMWEAAAKGDYVISTDALEHLPPDRVNETLDAIRNAAPHGFLRISLKEDKYGTERGLHLHESVFPAREWIGHLANVGIWPSSVKVYLDQSTQVEAALEVWF
jgi:hypothetical protein